MRTNAEQLKLFYEKITHFSGELEKAFLKKVGRERDKLITFDASVHSKPLLVKILVTQGSGSSWTFFPTGTVGFESDHCKKLNPQNGFSENLPIKKYFGVSALIDAQRIDSKKYLIESIFQLLLKERLKN